MSVHVTEASTSGQAGPQLPADLTERIRALRDRLLTGLVERDTAVRLALLSALSGEHLLLLGPPGTAKSLVAHRLKAAIAGGAYFERLLTKFTVPEELFGPLSIKGLEEDRYERLTASYLPKASVAFLDEIFKANSAILNSLLTLLNERQFDNGTRRETTPLIAVIGASNELPDGDELGALFDRFLLRLYVGPVGKDRFTELLRLRGGGDPLVPQELLLDAATLVAVQAAAERVDVPADVESMLCELRDWCTANKIAVSDRRWRKVVKLLQVSAVTNGRNSVSIWDCWLLQHCVWEQAEDREKAQAWYADRVGSTAVMDPGNLTRIVTAFEVQLKYDQAEKAQKRDDAGNLLFIGHDGKETTDTKQVTRKTRDGEPLYLAPDNAATDYGMNRPITDRTNGGDGYTEAELNGLYVEYHRHFASWSRRSNYLQDKSNWHMNTGKLQPALEPRRFSRRDLDASIEEITAHTATTADYATAVKDRLETLESDVAKHLWVLPEFAGPARSVLRDTLLRVEGLLQRLAAVRDGIECLPVQRTRPILTAGALAKQAPAAGKGSGTGDSPKRRAK
jgi:MoxR-like ATPase